MKDGILRDKKGPGKIIKNEETGREQVIMFFIFFGHARIRI